MTSLPLPPVSYRYVSTINDKSLMKLAENVPGDPYIMAELEKRVLDDPIFMLVHTPDWGTTIYLMREEYPDVSYNKKTDSVFVSPNVNIPANSTMKILEKDVIDSIILGLDEQYVTVNVADGHLLEVTFDEPYPGTGAQTAEVVIEDASLKLIRSLKEYQRISSDDIPEND